MSELDLIQAELARRELARRDYRQYLPYVHGAMWKKTRMSDYIAQRVQAFLTSETGNAYDILVVKTPPQHGKECADSTPVPTPNGWMRHGDLKIGDSVFGPDGKPVKVLNLIPQSEPASLLVTFSDGGQVKVHPNHEWIVYQRDCKPSKRTLETHVMMERGLTIGEMGKRGSRYRFQVDHNICVNYSDADLPCDPYFLGLWLGDGYTTKPVIAHHKDDTATIEKVVRRGYATSCEYAQADTGVAYAGFFGDGYQALKSLGLGCVGGAEKHIPDIYKHSSEEQRLELLAGMIDSDGYVYQKNGRVTISNANKRLIDDFAEVVRSLGWNAVVCAFGPKKSTSGIQGKQVVYQLCFNPDRPIPTALERKKTTKLIPTRRKRAIVSIEPCEPEHGMCITVEGGVYLVGETFIPTHNSMTLSETLPSWYMGRFPTKRIIMASYNEDSAQRFCRRNSDKIRQFGATLFGVSLAIDRSTELELDNRQGRMISRGIMSGITGNPADLIIIDDPIKNREEANSQTIRDKLWEEWQNSIKSRLAAGAKVILIMTPWHEDDLAARLLNSETNISEIRLPVEAEENDPLGREIGDALCPELGKDNAWLKQFKASYIHDAQGGARAWEALYMCRPRVEGGNLVDRSWWQYFKEGSIKSFGTEIISVDAAFKGTDSSDFVCITVWGKLGTDYYLRYCLNRHLTFSQTLDAIRLAQTLYPNAQRVLIEDKANGTAIIDVLQREMFCIPVNPKGGKEARVNAISPAIESGHVFLPENMPWLEAFMDQFSAFPAGAHDDMVDSTSQALAFLLQANGTPIPTQPDPEIAMTQYAERAFLDNDSLYDVYNDKRGLDDE